ncbi:MAG TPA: methyltransferase domain-containing protein, partial [Polyangiaceae bacterium]|nr:methyltransferase domain-containing protein [Polyangiaceae bacterium]
DRDEAGDEAGEGDAAGDEDPADTVPKARAPLQSVEPDALEDDLDATHEMSAVDLGAEDDAEEADEDELEEVDEAEVQSDPRGGRAREAPAPYASSVRLSDSRRNTPPTPPARSAREEALDPRTKRRARPWWEELFDDDFLRAAQRPTDGQVATEVSFIEARLGLAKGATILDLACGHGRHAIELTRRGYQVVGFDLSLAMLAHAADEAEVARQKVNFLHGDMRELPFEDKFDGVYCWGTSFGFFEEEKNLALLQKVYRALRPGGVFLLETINRDFVAARQPSLVWYEGDGCLCMDEAQVDFITSRLKVKRTIMLDDGRTREVDYSLRLYGLHELGKMMHEAGFRVIEVSGRLATPGIFFGADSPQCIVLAERD